MTTMMTMKPNNSNESDNNNNSNITDGVINSNNDTLPTTMAIESYDRAVICAWTLVPTIFVVIFVIGLVGNLFVLTTVLTNRQMRSTTNILILNLATADLLFIVVCVPFTGVAYLAPVWPFGRFLCRLQQYLLHVTAHASVYTLVFMSLDRFLAVVHPIKSLTIRTGKNTVVAVVILWLVISACNVPIFFDFDLVKFESSVLCVNRKFDPEVDASYARIFYGTFFLFGFFLPLAFVVVLYAAMVRRLLEMGRTLRQQRDRKKSDGRTSDGRARVSESARSKRRVTRMVIIVVSIFAACWFPVHVMFLVQFFVVEDVDSNFICARIFANCLAYTNSCLNPILYAFLSENFRSHFRRLCLCCFPEKRKGADKEARATCLERTDNRVSRIPRADDFPDRTTVANITSVVDGAACAPFGNNGSKTRRAWRGRLFARREKEEEEEEEEEAKAIQMAEMITNGGKAEDRVEAEVKVAEEDDKMVNDVVLE